MYLEVYIDVVFIINFIMDSILLLMVKKILKCTGSIARLLAGATVGAIGACILSILPNLNIIVQFLFSYIIICTAMIVTAYRQIGWKARVKAILLLYISTYFLGGIMNSLYYNTDIGYYFSEIMSGQYIENRNIKYLVVVVLFLLTAIPVYVKIVRNRSNKVELFQLELTYKEKSIYATGLYDTGNSLYDPIQKKPVLIAECSIVEPLLTENQVKFLHSILDTVEGKPGNTTKDIAGDTQATYQEDEEELNIMMIPYHSIGKSGILPAIVLNKIKIWNGEEQICNEKVLTAVSRNRISKEEKYQVILHRDMV